MMRSASFVLVLFYVLLVRAATAQQPLYRNFTDEDGLPSNTVYDIYESVSGYLYVTTAKGVCKFDGVEFQKVDLSMLQTEDMPMSVLDNQGRLWAANLTGEVVRIENRQASVVTLPNRPKETIVQRMEMIGDTICFNFVSLSNKQTTSIKYLSTNFKVISIESNVDKKASGGKLLGLKYQNDRILIYVEHETGISVSTIKNRSNQFSENFPKVLLSSDSLKFLDNVHRIDGLDVYFDKLFGFTIDRMKMVSRDELLLINKTDPKNRGVYRMILPNFTSYTSIFRGGLINSSYRDKIGRTWLCSSESGIYVVPALFHSSRYDGEKFESGFVKCLWLESDNLLVGYNDGILESYLANFSRKANNRYEKIDGITGIAHNKGEIFICSSRGILRLDSQKLSVKGLIDNQQGLKALFFGKGDRIFVANNLGLTKGIYQRSTVSSIVPLLNIRSYAISERNDTVLLGSTKGLYGYAKDSVFAFKGFKQPELYITKLFVDSSKTIWICTDGKGLLAYNNEKDIQYFGLKEGLPSLNCSDIVQIDKRRFAVGTDKGLWIYDKVNGSYFLFDKLDGLKSNEITALASDGTNLWVGTTKGLVKCEIASLQPNPEIPFVEIVTAQYEQAGKFSPMVAELNYLQNHVSFFLSSRALLAGKSRHYAYRLLGLDSNWVHTSEQKIEFLGLQPGKYRFEVKAFNEDGISSDGSTFYAFVIRPPWWKTTFFYISLTVLLLGLAFGLSYRYGQNIKKKLLAQYEIQTQINEFKQLALQSQMNPHFIFNSLNAIQSYLSTSDEINAMHYLSKFGRLIRMIFEQSKRKVIPIDQEVAGLQLYLDLEKLRFKNKVEYVLDVDPELYANDVMIPPLMVQPIVENSFRHGLFHRKDGGGLLEILFNLVDGRLQCIVRDNGVGRSAASKINTWKSDEHVSSAISNTSDRLKILDDGTGKVYMKINDLVDEQGEPCGTETILQF